MMGQSFSPKLGHQFSPKRVHMISPKVGQLDTSETPQSRAYFFSLKKEGREKCPKRGKEQWRFEK
jgi:hypothetical protein